MKNLKQKIIEGENFLCKSYGILSGSSGYILLLYYLKYYEKLYSVIRKIITEFEEKPFSILYSNGISGLLWALRTINADPIITYLDSVIKDLEELLIDSIQISEEDDLDFLHGLTGIMHYIIEFANKTQKEELIWKYLELLSNKTIKTDLGLSLQFFQPVEKRNLINFSLSHGIAAVIQILSRIYKQNIEISKSKALLNGFIYNVINNRQDVKKTGSNIPNSLEAKENKSRLAWCYGDLGTAISIWQAGDNTGEPEWKQIAEEILLQTTERTTLEDGGVIDPMMCHGSSGIATLYNRMWRNTNNERFLKARNHWLEETKKFARFSDGVAGYKNYNPVKNIWHTEYGLLDGAVGLALTFLQAESEEDIRWDKALLICS